LYRIPLSRADAPPLESEFPEVAGAAGVRFLPSGYVAPLRDAHDLDEPQRQILLAVDGGRERQFARVCVQIDPHAVD
jgi:hypothetical protein